MNNQIIHNIRELNFKIEELQEQLLPQQVLMVKPTFFNIDTPINVHMLNQDGKPHILNKELAFEQWEKLKSVYEKIGFNVTVLEGVENLPDMVFCANQSFPFINSVGEKYSVLSNMRDDTRHKEVPFIDSFFKKQGYKTLQLAPRSQQTLLEGMGDITWLGRKKLLLGGYGFRTDKSIYDAVYKVTNTPIVLFELKNPKFYHLDTCLSVLNSNTAMVCKEAFTQEGFELLKALFVNLLEIPIEEADAPGFACNAHCPDEKHVIIQKNNPLSKKLAGQYKFIPIEVDTSEFIKSGGSVYCMKIMYF
jgi:N-dimethylarginine dimethylaminohydrolase